MKTQAIRLVRRKRSAPVDNAFFKNESNHEQTFFAEPVRQQNFFQPQANSIQRKCDTCEEEEKVNRKPANSELSRAPDKKEEEEKKIHKKDDEKKEDKELLRKEGAANPAATTTSSYVNNISGKGSSLPKNAQTFFANRMGHDFSNVKIHTGTEAERSAKDVNAKAYAIDNNIVFNEGQYSFESYEGKKLLAHELTHIMQKDRSGKIARKEGDAETAPVAEGEEKEEPCKEASIDLGANTSSAYSKGAGTVINEKTTKTKGCPDCEDECVTITGTLKVPFNVATQIDLPLVPGNLTPCQQVRASTAINGPLLAHEKKHVKAFDTFNGTAMLPVNYKGCESAYTSHTEDMTNTEFERRKASADAKSAALDPFTVAVDLCCKEPKPKVVPEPKK